MAVLRHLLRPLKQISSPGLGYARAGAGTPRPPAPPPALGLRPRTISSCADQDSGMQYYRHGKIVSVGADPIPWLTDDQRFRLKLLGTNVFVIGINSFMAYKIITQLVL